MFQLYLKSLALLIPEMVGGSPENVGSRWICACSIFSRISMAFVWMQLLKWAWNVMTVDRNMWRVIVGIWQNKRLQHELELEKSRASLGGKFPTSSDNSVSPGIPSSAADPMDGISTVIHTRWWQWIFNMFVILMVWLICRHETAHSLTHKEYSWVDEQQIFTKLSDV